MANSRVPAALIRFHVGRLHVGTPDSEIQADIRTRCREAGATDAETEEAVKVAIDAHHENLATFISVDRAVSMSAARKIVAARAKW